MKAKATASIVMYKSDTEELETLLRCVLSSEAIDKIFLIDNSPTDILKSLQGRDSRIEYFSNPSNPGFGAAHNIAIKKSINEKFKYHFVVNPDVFFKGDVIFQMINYMEQDKTIGMMMPQILNLDGTIQNLPKLLPSPFSVFLRVIKKPKKLYEKFIDKYELRTVQNELIYNTPILSGCFTAINLKAIEKVGNYDDAYFMYFEDWDLSRRVHEYFKTIYFPIASVYHGYDSGANRDIKLFKIFLKSAIFYFNKWGWFFDKDRSIKNKKILLQFNDSYNNRI
jgi:GT2 family glycosyltransferase